MFFPGSFAKGQRVERTDVRGFYQFTAEIEKQVSELLENDDAVSLVENACYMYLEAQKTEPASRADLNKKLINLRKTLETAQGFLTDPEVVRAISLLVFKTSPSKPFKEFSNKLDTVIAKLSDIPEPRKGRSQGGSSRGAGRAADIFCDMLCGACQMAGYGTSNGMKAKVDNLLFVLASDPRLVITKDSFPRKILDSIQRVRDKKRQLSDFRMDIN